jgi:hypothetical protein
MNITLTWTAGGGATSQNVQYKQSTSGTWITHSTVSGTTNSDTINGLTDNVIYDFRVVTNCAGGTPAPSAPTQQINITCPSVSATPSDVSIAYSFSDLGASVTGYTVKLFSNDGTTELSSQTPSGTSVKSGTFTGLTASTGYKIRVIVTAGSFSKTNCAFTSVTTTSTPACNAPTGVTATITEDLT